jgi:hypothetical protein
LLSRASSVRGLGTVTLETQVGVLLSLGVAVVEFPLKEVIE